MKKKANREAVPTLADEMKRLVDEQIKSESEDQIFSQSTSAITEFLQITKQKVLTRPAEDPSLCDEVAHAMDILRDAIGFLSEQEVSRVAILTALDLLTWPNCNEAIAMLEQAAKVGA
jgi:hypothetical protein